jgi:spore coat polysaccharide biosynthesis predicted glycosyltransferase SpsG
MVEDPRGGDVVAVDSYVLNMEEVRRWAGEVPVAAFWDAGEPPEADLLVSLALEIPEARRGVSGPEYACLGRDYWRRPRRRRGEAVERVLVSTGGADRTDAAYVLSEAARSSLPDAEVVLVRGPDSAAQTPPGVEALDSPSSLREPLLSADLVLTAAGQTMLEALASGAPCVAVSVAANQRPGLELLARMGAVEAAELGDEADLRRTIAKVCADAAGRAELSARGMECVDGRGAHRVAEAITQLFS